MTTLLTIAAIVGIGIAFAGYLLLFRQRGGSEGDTTPLVTEIVTALSLEQAYAALLRFAEQTHHLVVESDPTSGALVLSSQTTQFDNGFRFPIQLSATQGGTAVALGISSFGTPAREHAWHEQNAHRRFARRLGRRLNSESD
ncbi:MAG: hypothetical protein VX589_03555 [Myxococcota bacterium]|nr:hypothetical protein [Myxococcota bacterium]